MGVTAKCFCGLGAHHLSLVLGQLRLFESLLLCLLGLLEPHLHLLQLLALLLLLHHHLLLLTRLPLHHLGLQPITYHKLPPICQQAIT
jgi:hypothetical protein